MDSIASMLKQDKYSIQPFLVPFIIVPPGVLLRSEVLNVIQILAVIVVTTKNKDLPIQTHSREVVSLTQHIR